MAYFIKMAAKNANGGDSHIFINLDQITTVHAERRTKEDELTIAIYFNDIEAPEKYHGKNAERLLARFDAVHAEQNGKPQL